MSIKDQPNNASKSVVQASGSTVNLLEQWTRGFPEPQREAVIEAARSASLAKVRRALRLIEKVAPERRGPVLNVELLSTYNLEPILPVLQLALNCLPSRAHIHLAPLDAIESFISQPRRGGPDEISHARVVIWRVEEVLPEALYPFSNGFPDQLRSRVDQVIARVEAVVRLHQANAPGVPLFVSTIPFPLNLTNPVSAAQHSAAPLASVARINRQIYDTAASKAGIYVLDLAAWAAAEGSGYLDPLVEFMARQPLSAKGQLGLALFLARSLRPLLVPRRKALAVDLDNTLWGGVLGEDGTTGLTLGHEFPGNVHLRLQRELLELRNRGVLLVLLSKNNENEVRQAFESLPDMLLKWDDFALRKIDWNHKHENLRAAASELGVGEDSFAFIDDSDYEREQMHQFIPGVLILNRTSDPLQTLRALWETDAFDSLTVSEEDRSRHRDYALRAVRDVEAHRDDLDAFLRSLEMEAVIEHIGPTNMERVITMLGKTNQFNLTTRRHSRSQLQSMLGMPGSIGLALRLKDKFGDQGIVAVLLAVPSGQSRSLIVDSFLVSCRALGRGLEHALWAAMIDSARQQDVHAVEAEYIPTDRNAIVADLYERLGLHCTQQSASSRRYVLDPITAVPFPSWINVKDKNHGA